MSKGNVKYKDGKLVAGLDTNEDGENLLTLKLNVNEAIQEALDKLSKGEESKVALDVKKVELEFGVGGMKLKVDTDQDGEHVLEVDLSFSEAIDEVTSAIKK